MVSSKKGFTLIELLVVITIIGILAVGGIQVYTSQIQKARDSTRVSNIMTLGSGFQQYLMDKGSFAGGNAIATADVESKLSTYIPTITNITESRIGSDCAGTSKCGYVFTIGPDTSGVSDSGYEVSAAFENSGNVGDDSRADEGGNDNFRFENGNNIAGLDSAVTEVTATTVTGAIGVIN